MDKQLEFNEPPESGLCSECGAKVVEYKFGINRGHVAFLKRLLHIGRPAHIDELGLTNSQYGNYSMTRRWGLTEQLAAENELERRKGGRWQLTAEGTAFLAGTHSVPKYIHTMRGKVTRISGQQVFAKDVDETYEYRGDYKTQAAEQLH